MALKAGVQKKTRSRGGVHEPMDGDKAESLLAILNPLAGMFGSIHSNQQNSGATFPANAIGPFFSCPPSAPTFRL